MDILIEEQIKAALYRFFQMQYFENLKNIKNKLYQLNRKELEEFFREQKKYIEEELIKFKSALEEITEKFGKEVANKLCNILVSSTHGFKKLQKEYLENRNFYLDFFRKYKFHYIVSKLEKMFLINLFLNLMVVKLFEIKNGA